MPTLPIRKPSRSYRLVQDLHIISEAIIPIHPWVPNPYTILYNIPPDTSHISVLDLKGAFFTIPLHPDSYFLFAFTWKDPDTHLTQQLTWTVLPQGFHDSPHLFAQAVAHDLVMCNTKLSTLLQYVDDLLLCSPSQQDSEMGTTNLLNFLASKGYQVSPVKAQLCLQAVTFLGFFLTSTSKALTIDRVQILRDLPPPNDAQEILSFLGFIVFFRHWIPNFASLAHPLYQAAKETPTGPLSFHDPLLLFFSQGHPPQALLNPSKPYHLFTDETSRIAKGVLTQLSGPIH
jgi:hypothetical protein